MVTLDPEYPIIDSVVRQWLAPLTEAPPFKASVDGVIIFYEWLTNLMAEVVVSPEARAWTKAFDETFPTRPGEPAISAMKKLDFLIWAGAEC